METVPIKENDKNVTNQFFTVAPPSAKADTSVTDWLITFLVMIIPLVNAVMLFVWAFGNKSSQASRANWAKAALLWTLICVGMYAIFASILGIGLFSLFNS